MKTLNIDIAWHVSYNQAATEVAYRRKKRNRTMYTSQFDAFLGESIQRLLDRHEGKIRETILNTRPDNILKTDEEKYITALVRDNSLHTPVINFDEIDGTSDESEIIDPLWGDANRRIRVPNFIIKLRYKGDAKLLQYSPANRIPTWSVHIYVHNEYISFTILDIHNNDEQVRAEKDRAISFLKEMSELLTQDIENYNGKLYGYAKAIFDARKQKLQADRDRLKNIL